MSYRQRFSELLERAWRGVQRSRPGAAPDLTCEDVVGLIADYLTGAMDLETAAAFEAHLRGCDNCIAFLNTYNHTLAMVQSLRCEDLPEEMEARVRAFLAIRRRGSGDSHRPPSVPVPSPIGRLFAWLRQRSTDSESMRMVLLPVVMVWTC